MKVAIAQFGRRVSPRFDHAQVFLVVKLDNGEVQDRVEVWTRGLSGRGRVAMLVDLRVNSLICGGVDDGSAEQLCAHGVAVYSSITGGVEDVLSCFLRGDLQQGMMLGEDGRCCGLWSSRAGVHAEGGEANASGR